MLSRLVNILNLMKYIVPVGLRPVGYSGTGQGVGEIAIAS